MSNKKRQRASVDGVNDSRGRSSTLADVAQHAGVSKATVSRCLSDPDKVRAPLRERVDASIRALSYTPHGAARALATSRSRTIGVIVPTLDIAGFAMGVQGLQASLERANHGLLIATSDFNRSAEKRQVDRLLQHGVDGVMLVGLDQDPELYNQLARTNTPYVCTWTYEPDTPHPCIGFDNEQAVRRITEYVLSMGHRRIAMIVGGMEHRNDRTRARVSGFRNALAGAGIRLSEQYIIEVPYGMVGGRVALRQLMGREDRPTAVVCGNDLFAIGALVECQRRGIRVPTDLSVTGFDDLEVASHFVPALTSVHIPAHEMGARAAQYLLSRLTGERTASNVELDVNVILRETVAAPNQ